MYDFDKEVQRKGTSCVKWDGPAVKEGNKPMWIADMDFKVAPAITKNLVASAEADAFGYHMLSDHYYEAIINWFHQRHGYDIKKEWITYIPNVVIGLHFAVQAISDPGDEIMIHTPVYGPFYGAVKDTGRTLVESPLKNEDGYYTIDLEDFERRITKKTKAVLFCNPHNPSGRVWTREELSAFAEICLKYNLFIISDEIHCELTMKGHKHTVISTLSEEIARRCIILTSPSKAFNIASVHVANVFIENEKIRSRFNAIVEKSHAVSVNAFAEAALIGAYEESLSWLDELKEYLEENLNYFVNFVHENIPAVTVCKPEGTYLVWLDFRKLPIPVEQVQEFLSEKCHVTVNDGEFFGKDGKGFVRFNVACPRHTMKPILEALRKEISAL